MGFRLGVFLSVIGLLGTIGCSKSGPEPLVRDPVNKITGTLLIDGKPEMGVAVRLARVNKLDGTGGTSDALTPSAFTDDKGKFSIGTYENGPGADGAPNGQYVLMFQWGAMNLMGGQYAGDKFNGKYIDPKKSEFKVTVEGKPVDLGVVELTSK